MATLYWVGGTATWNGTPGTKWATTSGGAGGAAVPTAADDVFFDASSTGTCTLSTSSVARSINCTGFTGTISHPASTTFIIGDGTAGASNIALKFVAGMTYTTGSTTTSLISFQSTSSTQQSVDFGGKTTSQVEYNGTGGSWQLVAGHTTTSASQVSVFKGTFDTNGQTCSWGIFNAGNSSTRTLTLGSSTITVSGTGTSWNCSNVTNLTLNSNTSTIILSGNGATFQGGGQTWNNLSSTGTGTTTIAGANTFNDLTRTVAAGVNGGLAIQGSTVINGVFTVTGAASGTAMGRIVLAPTIVGAATQRDITVNGSYSFTNVDFHYINALGSATRPWTGTSIGDALGNSNITFDASRTLYWVGSAGNWTTLNRWSLSSGGASASTAPLPQDDCYIDSNSGVGAGQTFNTGLRLMGRNVSFAGVPNNPTFSFGGFNPAVTGSFAWGAGMTVTNSSTANLGLIGTGSHTLTMNGVTHPTNFAVGLSQVGPGGTYTLQDDMDIGIAAYTLSAGALDANGFDLTMFAFFCSSSNTRTVNMGSGTWTLTGTGVVWNVSNTVGYTLIGSSATVLVTDTSATLKTFEHRQTTQKLGYLEFSAGGGGNVLFGPSGYYGTLVLGANKTYLINTSGSGLKTDDFRAKGTAGNLVTIQSATGGVASPGTPATLTQASGYVVGQYLSIRDSNATGGATWFAGAQSTNVSGNSGWIFTDPAITLTDSITASDSTAKSSGKALGDTATASDAISKLAGVIRADSVTPTDSIAKAVGQVQADSVTVSDTRSSNLAKLLADIATANDTMVTAAAFIRALSDIATVSDDLDTDLRILFVPITPPVIGSFDPQASPSLNTYIPSDPVITGTFTPGD
jgi:hypothetical protein